MYQQNTLYFSGIFTYMINEGSNLKAKGFSLFLSKLKLSLWYQFEQKESVFGPAECWGFRLQSASIQENTYLSSKRLVWWCMCKQQEM